MPVDASATTLITTPADEALRVPDRNRGPALTEAMEWLTELMNDGPVLATEVWAAAKADKMAESTLKTAKKKLGIRSKRIGGTHGELWWLRAKGLKLPNN